MDTKLEGRRCVLFTRGTAANIDNQRRSLREFADKYKMRVVGNIDIRNKEHSEHSAERAIAAFLDVQRIEKAAEILLISDLCRLTRKGSEHGWRLISEFRNAGITVVTPTEGVIHEWGSWQPTLNELRKGVSLRAKDSSNCSDLISGNDAGGVPRLRSSCGAVVERTDRSGI